MIFGNVDFSKLNPDLHHKISVAVTNLKINGQEERQLQIAIELGLHLYVTALEGEKYWIEYSRVAIAELLNYYGQDTKCDAYLPKIDKCAESILLKIGEHEGSLRLRQQRRGERDFIDLNNFKFLP